MSSKSLQRWTWVLTPNSLFCPLASSVILVKRDMFACMFYCHQLNTKSWVCLGKPTCNLMILRFCTLDGLQRLFDVFTGDLFISILSQVSQLHTLVAFILSNHFYIILPSLLMLFSGHPLSFLTKLCMHFSSQSYVLHSVPLWNFLIWSSLQYSVKATNDGACHYNFLYCLVTYSLLVPSSQMLLIYAVPLIWDTISHLNNTTDKIIILHIFSFRSLNSKREDSKLNNNRHTENLMSI